MTSLDEGAEDLVPRKAPVIDRNRFMAGLATDLSMAVPNNSFTALILVELAGFKHLNRRFGYQSGDSILALVYQRLTENVKKASLVARLGDDMFAIIVPDMQSLRLLPVAASKIQQILAVPFTCKREDVRLECYVGISVAPLNAHQEEALLVHAEQSLESARGEQDRCFVADDTAGEKGVSMWKIRDELNRAIGAGELSLNYQPKVCLQTFMPVAGEALMRWNSKKLGAVSPELFIPVAEQTGLILDLTEWAILTLPREAAHIHFRDQPLNISLNLSTKDIASGGLHATLESALNIWNMDCSNITLEITESTLMENPKHCFEIMEELKAMGFRISIDDFGTGYSSMSYFKLIPANEIKIDRCFVKNLVNDRDDQVLVKAIIALAHHFKMTTVAEGVEDMETLEMLMSMKCDYAQGYHFSKPLPGEAFSEWLASYSFARYFSPPKKRAS